MLFLPVVTKVDAAGQVERSVEKVRVSSLRLLGIREVQGCYFHERSTFASEEVPRCCILPKEARVSTTCHVVVFDGFHGVIVVGVA